MNAAADFDAPANGALQRRTEPVPVGRGADVRRDEARSEE
jgi:hypothetical protein